jgi:hypothetical protein
MCFFQMIAAPAQMTIDTATMPYCPPPEHPAGDAQRLLVI